MKTYMAKTGQVEQDWWLFDADDQIVGRMATKIATLLMGKHRPTYTPHVDTGDFIVVIHADKVKLTGKKRETKEYQRYSGYPGGLKSVSFSKYVKEKPEELFSKAVWGMLPKNRLGRKMLSKLFVYRGTEHPHQAQKPEPLKV